MSQKALMATPDMFDVAVHDGMRRAALYLHSLHRSDREYLLSQLSENQKSTLDTLLDELGALGIPFDGEWAQFAVATCNETSRVPSAQGERAQDQLVAQLMTAEPKTVGHVLLAEPNRVVAQVLVCQPWPWKAAFLEQAGAARRRIIGEYLQARPRAPSARFQQALLLGLHQRVVACAVVTPNGATVQGDSQPSVVSALMRRLQRRVAMRRDNS